LLQRGESYHGGERYPFVTTGKRQVSDEVVRNLINLFLAPLVFGGMLDNLVNMNAFFMEKCKISLSFGVQIF
jgi:hypothetical protein